MEEKDVRKTSIVAISVNDLSRVHSNEIHVNNFYLGKINILHMLAYWSTWTESDLEGAVLSHSAGSLYHIFRLYSHRLLSFIAVTVMLHFCMSKKLTEVNFVWNSVILTELYLTEVVKLQVTLKTIMEHQHVARGPHGGAPWTKRCIRSPLQLSCCFICLHWQSILNIFPTLHFPPPFHTLFWLT